MINKIAAITLLLLLGTSVATVWDNLTIFCEQTESEGLCRAEVNEVKDNDGLKSMK